MFLEPLNGSRPPFYEYESLYRSSKYNTAIQYINNKSALFSVKQDVFEDNFVVLLLQFFCYV